MKEADLKRQVHFIDAGKGFTRQELYVGKDPVGPHGGACGNVNDGTLVARGTACTSPAVAAMSNEQLLDYPIVIDGREARRIAKDAQQEKPWNSPEKPVPTTEKAAPEHTR